MAYGIGVPEISRPLIFLFLSTVLVLFLILTGAYRNSSFDLSFITPTKSDDHSSNHSSSTISERKKDRSLGGLLSTSFDESSCFSRYQSAHYWKLTDRKPSAYLIDKLRNYEALHEKCGPNTAPYERAIDKLKHKHVDTNATDCNYVVWIAEAGLGNRLLSLVSTFLYALLNDKVMLLRFPDDMQDILCEPFPDTTWILPPDFPLNNDYRRFGKRTPQSLGNMLRDNAVSLNNTKFDIGTVSPFVYLHIMHNYNEFDKRFYCREAQLILRKAPWLFLRSNQYFAPAFFAVSQYRDELDRLFPEKDSVFYHLGRYLLHPTNSVWGSIVRYYEAYLSSAKSVLALQVRVYSSPKVPFEQMLSQVINCTLKEELLPEISPNSSVILDRGKANIKAVLVTSLKLGYSDRIRDMYSVHSTESGEIVAVYQPSHEEEQQMGQRGHNAKALSEIFLLSFSDEIATTAFSTFGYVATGLSGVKSRIVLLPVNKNDYCVRALSSEPCFHYAPRCDCQGVKSFDVLPDFIRHCEEFPMGIKLV